MIDDSKFEIIKNFVIKDKESFELAGDIKDSFENIIKYIIEEIFKNAITQLNDRKNINLRTPTLGFRKYDYDLNVEISDHYKITIFLPNYFGTPRLHFLPNNGYFIDTNSEYVDLREKLKKSFSDCSPEDWTIATWYLNRDILTGITSYSKLYEVYINENGLLDTLSESFIDLMGIRIVAISDLLKLK